MTDDDGDRNGIFAGAAAAELGVGIQTLHYYEREQLIPAPPRTDAGYRVYPPDLMERLRFIRRAQALGLTLSEVRETLELAAIGESPCGRVQSALADKLEEVDRRIEEMTVFRGQLADLVARGTGARDGGAPVRVCSIIETAEPPQGGEALAVPLTRRRTSRR